MQRRNIYTRWGQNLTLNWEKRRKLKLEGYCEKQVLRTSEWFKNEIIIRRVKIELVYTQITCFTRENWKIEKWNQNWGEETC